MQLISISSLDDLDIEINSIDLNEDFDIILPFMSKNYMTNEEYNDLIDALTVLAEDNDFIFETERDVQDRSYVYHFMKESE